MPDHDTPDQGQVDTSLEARNQWLMNVNQKLLVMIKNAADVLEAYVQNVGAIHVELQKTQALYSKLHKDVSEALGEQSTPRSTIELQQPNSGDAET